jgi:hypothetical protein
MNENGQYDAWSVPLGTVNAVRQSKTINGEYAAISVRKASLDLVQFIRALCSRCRYLSEAWCETTSG